LPSINIVNVTPQFEVSLTDGSRVVICDRIMFIIQATGRKGL